MGCHGVPLFPWPLEDNYSEGNSHGTQQGDLKNWRVLCKRGFGAMLPASVGNEYIVKRDRPQTSPRRYTTAIDTILRATPPPQAFHQCRASKPCLGKDRSKLLDITYPLNRFYPEKTSWWATSSNVVLPKIPPGRGSLGGRTAQSNRCFLWATKAIKNPYCSGLPHQA